MNVVLAAPRAAPAGRRPVAVLAGIEARRYATRLSLWAGWAGTMALAIWHRTDWPGGAYADVLPLAFAPLALGTYVAAVRAGARDHETDSGALAEEAALGAIERAAARVLGLAVPIALTAMTVLAIAAVARLEGGFWLGEGPRRTDAALHTPAELAQPLLLVALAGALGVAAGRTIGRTVLAVAAGAFVWTAVFALSWMWNGAQLYPIAPVQTMPLRLPLPDVNTFGDTPREWFVESPHQYQRDFTRQLVHQPTVVLHDVYLAGLIACAAAGTLRRRWTVRLAGFVLAALAVVGQYLVSPF